MKVPIRHVIGLLAMTLLLCRCTLTPAPLTLTTAAVQRAPSEWEQWTHYQKMALQCPQNEQYKKKRAYFQERITQSLMTQITLLINQEQFDAAKQVLEKIRLINPTLPFISTIHQFIDKQKMMLLQLDQAEQYLANKKYEDAFILVTRVLHESPDHVRALGLRAELMKRQTFSASPQQVLHDSFHQKISLEYKNASLQQVFTTLSKSIPVNFFFDPDVLLTKKITFFVHDASAIDALRGILATNQLSYAVISEHSILIYPQSLSKDKHYQRVSLRIFRIMHTDAKIIAESLRTLLNIRDMTVNSRNQTILIKDSATVLRAAERLILMADQPSAEVELEMNIVEVSRHTAAALGLAWPHQLGLSLLSKTGGSGTTLSDLLHASQNNIGITNVGLRIGLSEENAAVQILANPRIRVKNNEKAKIQIGNRYPLLSSTTTSTGLVSNSVSFVDVGLKLEVEPSISDDNEVTIRLNLEVSNLVDKIMTQEGNPIYVIGNRNASTVLRLKNNETQLLGGLLSNSVKQNAAGIPGIGHLPLFGYLFANQGKENDKTEIILSITPHIIRSGSDIVVNQMNIGTAEAIQTEPLSLTQQNFGQTGTPTRIIRVPLQKSGWLH